VTNDDLPEDWSPERNRAEFVKWLDVLYRLVESDPTTHGLRGQSEDIQQILSRLARRLGFPRGPIEKRKEKVTRWTLVGRELHQREYIMATDPNGSSVAEQFHGMYCLKSIPYRFTGCRGGLPDDKFREQVLARLRRWREAVNNE